MTNSISIRGLIVGLYLFSVPVFSFSEDFGISFIPKILGLVVVGYAIIHVLYTGRIRRNRTMFFYFLFVLWTLAPTLLAGYISNPESHMTLVKVAIVTFSLSFLVESETDFVFGLYILFLSVFVVTFLNLNELMYMRYQVDSEQTERFAGSLTNANTAAIYALVIILSGIIIYIVRKPSLAFRMVLLMGMLLAVIIILFSGSKKGFLGLVILAIGVSRIFIHKVGSNTIMKIASFSLIFIGMFFLVYFFINSPFFYRIETVLEDASTESRAYLIRKALMVWSNSIRNMILGIGIDQFRFNSLTGSYSHSTITEVLVSTGLIGAFLYFSSLFSFLVESIKSYYEANSIYMRMLNTALISFIIIYLMINATAVVYAHRMLWPFLAIVSSYQVILKSDWSNNDVGIL